MTEWKESKIKDFAEVKGGKRLPKGKQLTSVPTKHPYIRIRDLGKSKYLELNPEIEFVDDETQLSIARYIVNRLEGTKKKRISFKIWLPHHKW